MNKLPIIRPIDMPPAPPCRLIKDTIFGPKVMNQEEQDAYKVKQNEWRARNGMPPV